jgi:hypothetical protein
MSPALTEAEMRMVEAMLAPAAVAAPAVAVAAPSPLPMSPAEAAALAANLADEAAHRGRYRDE